MKKLFTYLFIVALGTSCLSTKKIENSYQLFQTGLDSLSNFSYKELKAKEGDNLIIQVYTLATNNQEQVAIFNLPGTGIKAGNYFVNNKGEIDLPKIGSYKVAGLTCTQIKEHLKNQWSVYIKDIAVDVQMQGFSINVLGEVKIPGVKNFKSERATVIDAITAAGGLNDEGKRKDIVLIREENGKRTSYKIDLTTAQVYQSPVFQLQQNDLIFVSAGPLKFKSIQSTSFQQTLTPIATITSLTFTLINVFLIIAALRK